MKTENDAGWKTPIGLQALQNRRGICRFRLALAGLLLLACCSVGLNAQGPKPVAPKPEAKPQNVPASVTTIHEMTSEDVGAFLDGILPQQLTREDVAGVVVSIVKDGKVLFAK